MAWLGLIGGIILGALLWGGHGAIILGFIGWIVALVFSPRSSQPPVVESPRGAALNAAPREAPPEVRIERLEGMVAQLQERVSSLEDSVTRGAKPYVAPSEPLAEAAPIAAVKEVPEQIVTAPAEPIAEPVPEPQPEPPPIPEPIVEPIVEPIAAATASEPPQPPPPREPPPPTEPRAPRPIPGRALLDRMLEGNLVAKAGVVILFFGFAFLLKFAYDHGLFPPWMRLAAVAAVSVAMFALGRWLLAKKRLYAVVLMGGAMGLLYLDVFFAVKTFKLIEPPAAFALFALLGVATLLLAVRLDARAFASLGLLGGFLAPVLASSGGGHYVMLFSYYLLLNLVIVATSWFRSWRELNFLGFLFTFAIGFFWGNANYRPEHFATVEPFLIAFFFLYLAIPVLFAYRQPPQLKGVVDATLVFGMPLTVAMMQAGLTRGMGDHILAWSAALASLLYATLARVLWNRPNMRLLAEAHVALAIVFGTVAPYFAFEGYPSFAFWTVEGAAIYWIGCRQQRGLARFFALALQLGAAPYFWWVTRDNVAAHAVWNDRVIGCVLIGAASLTTAFLAHRFRSVVTAFERALEGWIVAWAGVWLLVGASLAVRLAWSGPFDRLSVMLVLIAVALAAAEYVGRGLAWPRLRGALNAHVPLIAFIAFLWFTALKGDNHPMEGAGAMAWPFAFALHFFLLHRQRRDGIAPWAGLAYRGAWILMLFLATWEAVWLWRHADYWWLLAIGVAGLVAAGLRFRLRELAVEKATPLSGWVVAWSLVWWFAALHNLVEQRINPIHGTAADLAIVAISVLLFELVGKALAWPQLRRAQVLLPLAIAGAALLVFVRGSHPLALYQGWAWLAAFGIAAFALWRQQRDGVALSTSRQLVFVPAVGFILATWEAAWRWSHADFEWLLAIGIAGLVAAGLRYRLGERANPKAEPLSTFLVAWSLLWWFAALHNLVQERIEPMHGSTADLAIVAISVLLFEFAGRALAWPGLRRVQVLLPMAILAIATRLLAQNSHPLANYQAWAWLAAFGVTVFTLWRQERDGVALAPREQRLFLPLAGVLLATWEAVWRWQHHEYGWVLAIGVVGLVAAGLRWQLRERNGTSPLPKLAGWMAAWALVWWFVGLHGLIDQRVEAVHHLAANLAMVAASVLLFELAGRALAWRTLRHSQVLLPIALVVTALAVRGTGSHPFAELQAWAWIAAIAVGWFALRRQERDGVVLSPARQNVFLFAAALLLCAWDAHWWIDRANLGTTWRFASNGGFAALGLVVVIFGLRRGAWPFGAHAQAFRLGVLFPLLGFALLWTLAANLVSDGTAPPWRYIPALNPLDAAQLALFAAAVAAIRPGGPAGEFFRYWPVIAGAAFLWLNMTVLRTVHHWGDVPFELHALLRSVVAQASLSLLWTATALVMMFTAGRRKSRSLWMAGAALLGVVVAKLFVNDLGNTGTVARIVSFIGVGVFMLVIGYLSPVPPRAREKT